MGDTKCRLADQHSSRGSDRLQPARRVDQVPRHHPLICCPDRDGRFPGKHPGAGLDRWP